MTNSKADRYIRRTGQANLLGLARIAYLGLVGAGFIAAASLGKPSEIGTYSLAVSLAAIATVVGQAGIDRTLLVEVAGGANIGRRSWTRWLFCRAPLLGLAAISLMIGVAFEQILVPLTVIVVSRVVLSDLESVAIAQSRLNLITLSTLTNGIASGLAIPAVSKMGAEALCWASALGNILAVLIVTTDMYRRHNNELETNATGPSLLLPWRGSLPFAGMAIAGAIYQRADLATMGAIGIGVTQLASYAIALKSFEALVAFRGAIVQHHSASHEPGSWSIRSSSVWAWRLNVAAVGAGALIIAMALLLQKTKLLSEYENVWDLVALVGVVTPMVMSHTITSTWVYSRPGSITNLSTSILLSLAAIGITVLLGVTGGTVAICFGLGIKEYVSFLAFLVRAKREETNTKKVERRSLVKLTICWPIGSAALAVAYWIFA